MKKSINKIIAFFLILGILVLPNPSFINAAEMLTPPPIPQAPDAPTPPPLPIAPLPPLQASQSQPINDNSPSAALTETVTPTPNEIAETQNKETENQLVSDTRPPDSSIEKSDAAKDNTSTKEVIKNDDQSNADMPVIIQNQVDPINTLGFTDTSNGVGNTDQTSLSVKNSDNLLQENSGSPLNSVNESTVTGGNANSINIGNSGTFTGDANTTGTVINAVNTNIDNIASAEFNVVNDHQGDLLLDFSKGCRTGCSTQNSNINNMQDTVFSDNTASVSSETDNITDQANTAIVGNDLNLLADSGNNSSGFNTGGDSSIITGDANVAGNALTFANNNISGNVVFSVVNIFGNLTGDIVLTEAAMNAFCGNCMGNTMAAENTNAAYFVDNTSASHDFNALNEQFNVADIDNNLILNAQTGENDNKFNTGGNSRVVTGETNTDVNVLNVINNNIAGGNMWLVIINNAGKWLGKIIGASDGSSMAGSEGLEFSVDDKGNVTATNNGNGAGAGNSVALNDTSQNNTNQNNDAKLVNNLDLTANTGKNNTNFNTGGDSNIITGDAKIIANIVNFVNNNVKSAGKLFVTVVNVFGSWVGDFVGPGQKQESAHIAQNNPDNSSIGGVENTWHPNYDLPLSDLNPDKNIAGKQYGGKVILNSTTPIKSGTERSGYFIDPANTLIAGARIANENKVDVSNAFPLKNEDQVNIASAKLEPARSDNVLRINLAWLVFMMPFAAIISFLRKINLRNLQHKS